MPDFLQIMQLLLKGYSYAQIVEACDCSRRAVARAKKVLETHQLTVAQLEVMTPERLSQLFPDRRSQVSSRFDQPDFAGVVERFKHARHFTLQQAWQLYVARAAEHGLRKYSYSQFCARFSSYAEQHDLVAVLRHIPGNAMHVDWAGDTLTVTDLVAGKTLNAYLFVATLPYSGMIHVTACLSMKTEAFLDAHIKALQYFGGVPQLIIPDNPATATYRPQAKDPAREVTERYRQFADFYSTAIVPARVKKPRDKAAVESAVHTVNKRIIGYLEAEMVTSIGELNELIAERLVEINYEMTAADDTTRAQRFAEAEQAMLQPLPDSDFTVVEFRQLKVARNYHITCDRQHYSVPYQLVGQTLKVRTTQDTITVFHGNHVVAQHTRLHGRKGQYSTADAHCPEHHRDIQGLWSPEWFVNRAAAFGPATVEVITDILDAQAKPAQGFLACQNILANLGPKGKTALEHACQQLLTTGARPSYSALKRLQAAVLQHPKPPPTRRAVAPAPARAAPSGTFDSGQPTGVLLRDASHYDQDREAN